MAEGLVEECWDYARGNVRRLVGQGRVGERLNADIVADIYKSAARWVGMPAKQVDQVSGHSVRIGATYDLLALNIDLASIMQSGRCRQSGWPDADIHVMPYEQTVIRLPADQASSELIGCR